MKSFRGILVIGERNVFAGLCQIIGIAEQANVIMNVMLENTSNEPVLTENMHKIHALENNSDEAAFKLSQDITGGAVSPNIIDNLIECVHLADDIVDNYYYLSRELSRMVKANNTEEAARLESEWGAIYSQLLSLMEGTISKLQQILSTGNVADILELRKEIEHLEHQGDDIKDAAFDKLYRMSANLHFLQFYHYKEMLHKCDDLLDNCEDLADIIVSIVTSIRK
ncbi:MAG TPA: DUF47 family protein [Candidatus Deferrimicrobiaceae bacterium]|nr:DUF47 family protein [Candidatus Deferrimicrobiaceae bacterium]